MSGHFEENEVVQGEGTRSTDWCCQVQPPISANVFALSSPFVTLTVIVAVAYAATITVWSSPPWPRICDSPLYCRLPYSP